MRRYSNFVRTPIRRTAKKVSPVSKRERTRPLEVYVLPNGVLVWGWLHKDTSSPDGVRFESQSPAEFRHVRNCVRDLAEGFCEKCPKLHFIGDSGHPHHDRNKKMGGGFTDDRVEVNGIRQLWWVCFDWHRDEHDGKHA